MSAAKVKSPSTKKLIKPKPKGATNAFGFYIAEQLKSQTSFDRSGTPMIDASEQWKLLSDEEKVPYYWLAKKDLERYNVEKEHMNAMRLKRPCNSYLLFVKNFMVREKGNYPSVTDAISRASTEWNEMTDNQKAPYIAQAKTLSDKYKQDKARLAPPTDDDQQAHEASATSALKPRSRAATTKSSTASKAKKSASTKARSAGKASKAKKSGTKTAPAPKARAASKPRAAAAKPRAVSKARAASKPRAASKARKPVKAATKGKKAGSKK